MKRPEMRVLVATVLLIVASVKNGAIAQQLPLNVVSQSAATVQELLKRFLEAPQINQESKDALKAFVGSLNAFFVPGILGSEIKAAGEKIWPQLLPSPEQLQLEPAFMDETVSSDSDPQVSEEIYGTALAAFRKELATHNIPFFACGYDWRRDIRAGAADLERCLNRDLPQNRQSNLILVAHSMGGLVTWVWNQEHEAGRFSPKHKVAAIVILGSPLSGSCELLRMVQSGYVQPTDYTGYSDHESLLTRLGNWFDRQVREIENAFTSFFSQNLRATVLSWPGAIELAPLANDSSPCVSNVFLGSGSEAKSPPSHFNPEFWRNQPGNDFLSGLDPATLPGSLERVLQKAAEFRQSFSLSRPRAPTFLYFSGLWVSPSRAALGADGHLSVRPWYAVEGDGRVPMQSAMVTPNWSETYFDAYGTRSVHGDLPIDEDFLKDFFSERLPKFINAIAAVKAIEAMLEQPMLMDAYIRANGKPPFDADVAHSLGNTRPVTQQSQYVQNAAALVERFRVEYCTRMQCADYAQARALRDKQPSLSSARHFADSLAQLPKNSPRAVFAMGNKGLELAKATKWESATVALGQAVENFENLPDSFDRDPNVARRFKEVVIANYGRSLAMVGRCEEAEPFLEQARRNRFAFDSWRSPCTQRDSGQFRASFAQ